MKKDISAFFCTNNYVKSFKSRENIQFQNPTYFAIISQIVASSRQIVGVDLYIVVVQTWNYVKEHRHTDELTFTCHYLNVQSYVTVICEFGVSWTFSGWIGQGKQGLPPVRFLREIQEFEGDKHTIIMRCFMISWVY